MKENNSIAIVFDDLTEFFVVQPTIKKLENAGYSIDLIVPYDSGYNGLAEHTLKKIKELGYSVKNDAPKDKIYKILLTPYPGLEVVKRTKFIYHLRYPYGAISPKPNPTYLPDLLFYYDAIFSFNKYDSFLSVYGPIVYSLPYWRYHNFKKVKSKSSKPTLLLLPTFGSDISFINHLTDNAVKEIKKHFTIIAKAHHAVHFGIDGKETLQRLQDVSDEFYDSDVAIDTLLSQADIVLSDSSGAIFESICAGIPVALFIKDPNCRHLGKFNTLQYQLVQEGVIPQAKKASEILPMLLNIKPYIKKQQKAKTELFICNYQDPFQDFLKIIKHYITTDADKDKRKILHDIFLERLAKQEHKIEQLEQEVAKHLETSAALTEHIEALQNSTSWKITKPLRKLKGNSNAKK